MHLRVQDQSGIYASLNDDSYLDGDLAQIMHAELLLIALSSSPSDRRIPPAISAKHPHLSRAKGTIGVPAQVTHNGTPASITSPSSRSHRPGRANIYLAMVRGRFLSLLWKVRGILGVPAHPMRCRE